MLVSKPILTLQIKRQMRPLAEINACALSAVLPSGSTAYGKLGYPHQRFNDRVLLAIEDLLESPKLSAPIPIEAAATTYKYRDATIEARSVGQKIMMRIGLENELQVKALLEALRNELLRRMSSN